MTVSGSGGSGNYEGDDGLTRGSWALEAKLGEGSPGWRRQSGRGVPTRDGCWRGIDARKGGHRPGSGLAEELQLTRGSRRERGHRRRWWGSGGLWGRVGHSGWKSPRWHLFGKGQWNWGSQALELVLELGIRFEGRGRERGRGGHVERTEGGNDAVDSKDAGGADLGELARKGATGVGGDGVGDKEGVAGVEVDAWPCSGGGGEEGERLGGGHQHSGAMEVAPATKS